MKTILHAVCISLSLIGLAVSAEPEKAAAPANTEGSTQLRFKGYDGLSGRDDVKKMSFQVDWLNRKGPSEFVKIGEIVPGTPYKVVKFEYKTRTDGVDASELTLADTATQKTFVLVLH